MNGGDVLGGDGDKEEGGDVDEERDDTNNTTTAEGGIISNSTSKGGAEDMEEEVEGANAVTLDELARRVTAAAIFIIEMYNIINIVICSVEEI